MLCSLQYFYCQLESVESLFGAVVLMSLVPEFHVCLQGTSAAHDCFRHCRHTWDYFQLRLQSKTQLTMASVFQRCQCHSIASALAWKTCAPNFFFSYLSGWIYGCENDINEILSLSNIKFHKQCCVRNGCIYSYRHEFCLII